MTAHVFGKNLPLAEIDIGQVAFRFWMKAYQVGKCIEWQGNCDAEGYGKFTIFKRTYRAHRIAYFLYYGIDPGEDHLVLHQCDNPACVNPRHLFLGNQKKNIGDMDAKGRRGNMSRRGEKSGRSILTEKDVLKIRQSNKSLQHLATIYGVSRSCVHHAKQGRNWSHLS